MKQVIVICGEDKLRCEQILELLVKTNENNEIILRVTTNVAENNGYIVVDNNEFFDMVEQGRILAYTRRQNSYYGTPYISKENVKDQYIFNDVEVALDIKKRYPKAITIYVIPKEISDDFKTSFSYQEARKLDFLVAADDLLYAARKIEEIVRFIEENGIR